MPCSGRCDSEAKACDTTVHHCVLAICLVERQLSVTCVPNGNSGAIVIRQSSATIVQRHVVGLEFVCG
eukprot:1808728-Amphidinium_carterae.1